MERRDIIKDQIEQLGRALGAILARFLGTKAAGNVTEGIEAANESLRSQLDLDVGLMATLDTPELQDYLAQRKLRDEHLNTLADYLIAWADAILADDPDRAYELYRTVLRLYDIIDAWSDTHSLARFDQENRIRALLS
ncbi:MAG: hypothetical protein WA958_12580 [Tunicatimonas sp.]